MNFDSRVAPRTRSANSGDSSVAARKLPSMSERFWWNSSTGQPNGTTVRSSCVGIAAQPVAANALHRAVGGEDLVDHEALAQLHARLDGGLHEQLVEDRAPRAVAVTDSVDRLRRAGERQRPEVEG